MDVSNPKKRGRGRRKIEIKKVEGESRRLVTFSKRRQGLFKKACELCELSGAKIAVFVMSEQGKPYICGDVDSIFDQYLTGKVSDHSSSKASLDVELMRKECEETVLKLKQETKNEGEERTEFWWEKSVEETVEEWLKTYEAAMVQLKRKVEGELEMRRKKAKASTSSSARDHHHHHDHPPVDQLHYDGFSYDDQYHIEDFVGLDGYHKP